MVFFRTVFAIAGKDLRLEYRTRDVLPPMLVFSLLVIVVFNFAFDPGVGNTESFAPGVLLVAFTFAGMLGLARSFAAERELDAVRGLLLAPIDRSAVYVGKLLSNLVFLGVILVVSLAALGFFFGLDLIRNLHRVVFVLALTLPGFVAAGTLHAALTANLRLREILLPILLFPATVAPLIASVKALQEILRGETLSAVSDWLRLLAAYDIIIIVVGILTFEFILEEQG